MKTWDADILLDAYNTAAELVGWPKATHRDTYLLVLTQEAGNDNYSVASGVGAPGAETRHWYRRVREALGVEEPRVEAARLEDPPRHRGARRPQRATALAPALPRLLELREGPLDRRG